MLNIFEEPSEKGSSEYLKSTMGKVSTWEYLLALVVILLIVGGVFYVSHRILKVQDEQVDIYEENGALYYPDGSLVRNYEQFNVYLTSQSE